MSPIGRDAPSLQNAGAPTARHLVPDASISSRLVTLASMTTPMLRVQWQRLYRVLPPARVARELLLLGVAWKLQEQTLGGLSPPIKRILAALTQTIERDGDIKRRRIVQLKPGAKLVRQWRGTTHVVLVLDDGFEWRGKRWRSLSEIAQSISGAHWSGPRFFGLTGKARRPVKETDNG